MGSLAVSILISTWMSYKLDEKLSLLKLWRELCSVVPELDKNKYLVVGVRLHIVLGSVVHNSVAAAA
jgi:hypothetical protein